MMEKQEVKLNNLRNEIAYWYELLVLYKNYPYTKKRISYYLKLAKEECAEYEREVL